MEDADCAAWFEQLLNIQGLQLLQAHQGAGGTGEAPDIADTKTDFANAPKTLLMVPRRSGSLGTQRRLLGGSKVARYNSENVKDLENQSSTHRF